MKRGLDHWGCGSCWGKRQSRALFNHENPPSLFTMLKSAGRFISKATKSTVKKQFPLKKFGQFNLKHYLCTH
jgi:hypothetical protein